MVIQNKNECPIRFDLSKLLKPFGQNQRFMLFVNLQAYTYDFSHTAENICTLEADSWETFFRILTHSSVKNKYKNCQYITVDISHLSPCGILKLQARLITENGFPLCSLPSVGCWTTGRVVHISLLAMILSTNSRPISDKRVKQ